MTTVKKAARDFGMKSYLSTEEELSRAVVMLVKRDILQLYYYS